MSGIRVLASAYCCSPFEGSEHYAGRHFLDQIARHQEVIALVPRQLRGVLGRLPQPPNLSLEYVPTPLYVPWERAATGSFVTPALSYYLFSILAFLRGRRLVREGRVDVAHHLTIANYRFPSLLPYLRVPCVLGPLGGGEAVPAGFESPSAYGVVRQMSLWMAGRDPILGGALARAGRLLVANRDTATRIGERYASKVELMTYGFDPSEAPVRRTGRPVDREFTVLCVSRLVRQKGVDLLVRAIPSVATALGGHLRVLVYGSGREAEALATLARSVGADPYVEFHRPVERRLLWDVYARSDMFCFPSLRDTCPVALLEAMAAGLPAIVLDHSGPGLIVTDESGIRVPARGRDQTVAALGASVLKLARESELREALGHGARARIVRDFSWDERGERLARTYRELLETQKVVR